MNTLLQDPKSLLIGSRREIERVARADEAKVLCVSDSHGAYYTFHMILEYIGDSCDALIFTGDGMCDIARLVDNAIEDPAYQKNIPPVIGIVEGNNDADLYPVRNVKARSPYFTELKVPVSNTIEVCGKRIFFTHGHRYSLYMGGSAVEREAKNAWCTIALFGHTHIPYESFGDVYMLNPGSCYLPRYAKVPTFATMRLKKNSPDIESIFYEITSSGCRPVFLKDIL